MTSYLLKNVSNTTNSENLKDIKNPVVIVWNITAATGVSNLFHSVHKNCGSIRYRAVAYKFNI